MQTAHIIVSVFFERNWTPTLKNSVLLPLLLLLCISMNGQQQADWLAGSWGITYPVYGGSRMNTEIQNNGHDYVAGAQEIVDELPTVGHIITNLSYFANSHYFTLSANANVDVAKEIDGSVVPNSDNDQIIFDVLKKFKNSGKKIILYISTSYFSRASAEVQAKWKTYYTNNFGGNEYAAYEDLIEGFVINVRDYADGYWLDTTGQIGGDNAMGDFTAMLRATDPGCILGINSGKLYFDTKVASDGTDDLDPTTYKVVKHKPATGLQDFTHGHVTPIAQKAPVNSWGYEEFTIPDMVANPWADFNKLACLSHAWFPTRERWHLPQKPLVFGLEQAYRFVRRITDGGAAITFATTTDPGYAGGNGSGHIMADEMVIMKEINNRLLMNPKQDYIPFVRPKGALLVGETAPNHYQHIDFQQLAEKKVGDADFSPKASASSGATVTYTSSNTRVATIVNNKIRIQGAGTTNITASQNGNTIFAAASDVVRQLTVTTDGGGGTDNDNLALSGTATQSTTLNNAAASLAIDGNTAGNFGGGSVTAAAGADAWWQVDLGSDEKIGVIKVFNRTDSCCIDRLSDFTVFILDSNGNTTYSQTFTNTPSPAVTLDAAGALGQVIRIESNNDNSLNLAEVEVYAASTLSVTTNSLANTLKMYPNPMQEQFVIEINKPTNARYTITDIAGKTLLSGSINEGSTTINSSYLTSGLYLIKIANGKETYIGKLSKK